jgi:hypothetical protein
MRETAITDAAATTSTRTGAATRPFHSGDAQEDAADRLQAVWSGVDGKPPSACVPASEDTAP